MKDFEQNKQKVVDLLLKTIGECKPQVYIYLIQVHANVKKSVGKA